MKKYIYLVGCLLVVVGLAVGCGSTDGIVTPNDELEASVHIGVMPIVDAIPIYLAHENGYFKEKGLDVTIETLPLNTQGYGSQVFDLQMMEPVDAIVNEQTYIKQCIKTNGMYRLLMRESYTSHMPTKIATVKGSYNEYLIDTYLSDLQLEKIYVGEEILSFTLLRNEEVDMALLPEPLATIGLEQGMIEKEVNIREDVGAILIGTKGSKAFVEAYNLAVEKINENPDVGKAVLMQHLGLEELPVEKLVLPIYMKGHKPTRQWLESISEWIKQQI
ncbi:MAG: ABC transporter substrate-binding protein [Cellulosilyticaceae bacterium]